MPNYLRKHRHQFTLRRFAKFRRFPTLQGGDGEKPISILRSRANFLNSKGNTTLMGMMIISCLSFILIQTTYIGLAQYRQRQSLRQLSLCSKKYLLETKQVISDINNINRAILLANSTKVLAAFIPQIGIALALSIERAKKLAMAYQELKHVAYLKKVHSMKSKSCPIPLSTVLFPYAHTGLLTRDVKGLAKMREQKWKIIFSDQHYSYWLDFSVNSNIQTDSKTKVSLYSKDSPGFSWPVPF